MALTRKPFWDTRLLHNYLLERARMPYQSGSNDCATFAGDGILAITGTDIMAELRGYTSADEAFRTVKSVTGGATLEAAIEYCAAKHGLIAREHPLTAQRGDLVLYRNGDHMTAGLVHLNGRDVVSPGESGLMRSPLTAVTRAWTY